MTSYSRKATVTLKFDDRQIEIEFSVYHEGASFEFPSEGDMEINSAKWSETGVELTDAEFDHYLYMINAAIDSEMNR